MAEVRVAFGLSVIVEFLQEALWRSALACEGEVTRVKKGFTREGKRFASVGKENIEVFSIRSKMITDETWCGFTFLN